jgi:hypothetical protein
VSNCGAIVPFGASVTVAGGAYHLISSQPVMVYQFSALEAKGAGGPAGKDWSACPGNSVCAASQTPVGCFSFTNDASLLLPTTALTGNYRVAGVHGWTAGAVGDYFAVTGTQDGTTVTIRVSATGAIAAGGGIPSTAAGGTTTFTLNTGDVAEVVGSATDATDLSGSLVKADKPVQVIAASPV